MPASARKTISNISNLSKLIDSSAAPNIRNEARLGHWDKVRSGLINFKGASPWEAEAATELAVQGYLNRRTIRALRQQGVKVPRSWIASGTQTGPYAPGASGTGSIH